MCLLRSNFSRVIIPPISVCYAFELKTIPFAVGVMLRDHLLFQFPRFELIRQKLQSELAVRHTDVTVGRSREFCPGRGRQFLARFLQAVNGAMTNDIATDDDTDYGVEN